jgi:hypothetical protein
VKPVAWWADYSMVAACIVLDVFAIFLFFYVVRLMEHES